MPVIKDEYLLVRFSRLLRDEEPFPTTNQIVNENIALNIQRGADYDVRFFLSLPFTGNDLTVTTTIQP